ncbi:MAG: CRTAC1 family protein [Deltaproteobacteria bacterium]|nr:CRTAC1 family protein [Deltaproteobacteria bacterium]
MKYLSLSFILVLFGCLIVSACDGADGEVDAGLDAVDAQVDDAGTDPDIDNLPPAICFEIEESGPFALHFTEVSEQLDPRPNGLAMNGNSVTIADIDGDHWPDIVLARGRSDREDPEAPIGRYHLLRNDKGQALENWTWSSGLFATRDGAQGRGAQFVVFGDVDNDGDQDAFVTSRVDYGNEELPDPPSWFINQGDGSFVIGPEQWFSTDEIYAPLVSAALLDYDHDGNLDMFLGQHYARYGYMSSCTQDGLFRGDGAGGFSDVTVEAGLETWEINDYTAADATNHKPTWGVTACDLDGDGWDDLLSANYARMPNGVYRNTGGTFEDLTLSSGLAHDDIEEFRDNEFYKCYCRYHQSHPICEDAPLPRLNCQGLENAWQPDFDDQHYRLGGNTSNLICGDLDNDGDTDVLRVELTHYHVGISSDLTGLLYNQGFPDEAFVAPDMEDTGLVRDHVGWWNEGDLGGALADLDNDGRLDVLVASSDYPDTYMLLWQQQVDGSFVGICHDTNTCLARAHGLAVVDYDRDGDYDLVVGTTTQRWYAADNPPRPDRDYVYVYRNDTGQSSNKLMLHLTGAGAPMGANRNAYGARIEVRAGSDLYVRQVQGPHGLNGFQHDPLVIIGVGAHCQVDEVRIKWPNAEGTEEVFGPVQANYVLNIVEGQGLIYQTLEEYAPRG